MSNKERRGFHQGGHSLRRKSSGVFIAIMSTNMWEMFRPD